MRRPTTATWSQGEGGWPPVFGVPNVVRGALRLDAAPRVAGHGICLALGPAAKDRVRDAALSLGRELLAFLQERKPDVDPQPDIARYLADGTLERHLGFAE